jgi:hypothetical protein
LVESDLAAFAEFDRGTVQRHRASVDAVGIADAETGRRIDLVEQPP